MSIQEWKIKDINKKEALRISHECEIPFVCAAILYTRGLKSAEDINKFLKKSDDYESPFDMKDMDKAVARVKKALESNEKICIYGDYDADGITATALVFDYLKNKGADVFCYIPYRGKEGYGLNISVIDFIKDMKAKLIFTVDNGISAEKEVEYASSLKIDVVVTDHHRAPEKLPNAAAVVDPYREDCSTKYKNFAGVGVAFKFIQAMENENDFDTSKYLDLVAIGTIGDSIELIGETRNIVKDGIKNIMQFRRPGINSLIEISGLKDKQISSTNIAFCLVPRINASGRMGDSALALKLLISENEKEAYDLANELNELNNERKATENEILDSVEELLAKEPDRKNRKIIIEEGKH
ncbi:MAG: DHH family phosphoesterase, partial [Clostridia bacterium]|nr:DHH family phosphoesterase [Clostridia bacterium]